MTTANQALEAIQALFVANYTGVPVSRVLFQNENSEFADNTKTPWVRLSVLDQTRAQETLGKAGNRRFRPVAQVFVQVFTATDIGVKTGDDLAREALELYEAKSFSGLDFNNGVIRRTGADGKWYQHIVEVDFDYEEIK